MTTHWFPRRATRPPRRATLFCLPHAGGGVASYFRWTSLLGERIDVVPIHLPGRESRYAEPAYDNLAELADDLTDAILGELPPRYSFFGHSMGGLIAFEVTHRLSQEMVPLPNHLFLSAIRSPLRPGRFEDLRDLPDEELIQSVLNRYTPGANTSDKEIELMRLLVKTMRADVTMLETYRFDANREELDCPITVLGGRADPVLNHEELQAWSSLTCNSFDLRLFDGGHFYIRERAAAVCQLVRERVDF